MAGGPPLTLLLCLGPYNASNVPVMAGFLHPNIGGQWRRLGSHPRCLERECSTLW